MPDPKTMAVAQRKPNTKSLVLDTMVAERTSGKWGGSGAGSAAVTRYAFAVRHACEVFPSLWRFFSLVVDPYLGKAGRPSSAGQLVLLGELRA